MGSYNKSWHAVLDTPEQIQMCFSCQRPKCVDCIGRRLEGVPGCKKEKKKSKRKED